MHEQVKQRLQQSNAKHKKRADLQRRTKVFEEGEMVMAHLRKEIFPMCTYNKPKYKRIGPCKILRKTSKNAYKIELLETWIPPRYSMLLICMSTMKGKSVMRQVLYINGRRNYLLNLLKK